jgi:hypothetical protein
MTHTVTCGTNLKLLAGAIEKGTTLDMAIEKSIEDYTIKSLNVGA